MVITIAGTEYIPNYGFEFIAKLNDFYFDTIQGVKFNQGLNKLGVGLLNEEPDALVILIMAALATNDKKPSKKQIEEYLMEEAEKHEDGLNSLFEEFLEEIKKQPLLKGKLKRLMGNPTEQTEQVEQPEA